MQLAADFGTGQVLWSILWFFLFFVWIMLIFTIFGDIIRNHEMSGGAKALWSIFIIFVPFLGIFIYLIVNGGKMGERQVAAAKAQEAAMQDYIRTTASSGGERRRPAVHACRAAFERQARRCRVRHGQGQGHRFLNVAGVPVPATATTARTTVSDEGVTPATSRG